jgi:hypothetical protein
MAMTHAATPCARAAQAATRSVGTPYRVLHFVQILSVPSEIKRTVSHFTKSAHPHNGQTSLRGTTGAFFQKEAERTCGTSLRICLCTLAVSDSLKSSPHFGHFNEFQETSDVSTSVAHAGQVAVMDIRHLRFAHLNGFRSQMQEKSGLSIE